MKRTLLLSIILGLTLTLTGCKPSDAESNVQQSATSVTTSETTSAVGNESAIASVPETTSGAEKPIGTQSDPIVTDALDALDTPTNAVEPEIETIVSAPVSTAKSDEISISETASPQLETVPEDADIEEDTGDFGELFS